MPSDTVNAKSTNQQEERAEVDTVLASEMFRRAPNLSQILSYVCNQYFAGEAAKIKEYNIAVEALGRPAGFDTSADTIVRVEASRLRRRLQEYYTNEGADHHVLIRLPKTGYVPEFVVRQRPQETPDREGGVSGASEKRERLRRFLLAGGLGVACLALALAFILRVQGNRDADGAPEESRPAASESAGGGSAEEGIRILAGLTRPKFVDSTGRAWSGDRYFTGGAIFESLGEDVLGVLDPTMYHTARRGDFRYDIPLKPGVYELRLMFAETTYGKGNRLYTGEGSRLFHVDINGTRRLSFFDILADAGAPNTPADRIFKDITPAKDGLLHLAFSSAVGGASLNGIEILPGTPGKIRPVRIACGGRTYYDRAGRSWGGDRYFIGGRPLTKPTIVEATTDPELYGSERWGHFTYSIPVALDGRYTVTLKFADTHYGKSNPGRNGIGSRWFDVYCNGVALLRNFDIIQEAGSENKALDKVFRGLTPNAQGKLELSFVPVKEYATVRAIEVIDESQ